MRNQIRIRPRFWLVLPERGARWGWVPLSLIFRKQRFASGPAQSVSVWPVYLLRAVTFLSRITQHYTHDTRQIFARSIELHHFFLNRAAAERAAPARDSRGEGVSVFNFNRGERRIEALLRLWTFHESRQSFATAHLFRAATKRMTEDLHPAARAVESGNAAPASRLRTIPDFARPRLFEARSSLTLRLQDVQAVPRKQTWEALAEDRLAPRFRRVDSRPVATAAVSFAAPSVSQVWRQPMRESRDPIRETRDLPGIAQNRMIDSSAPNRIESSALMQSLGVPPPRIEGLAMDKIADDVMKRIERHLRIERERRGI